MKILPNAIPAIKIYSCLKYLIAHRKRIMTARSNGDFEAERAGIRDAIDTWSHKLLESFNIDLIVNGKENLPTEGPVVFVANHQGYADIPVCCAALSSIQFGFISKEELLKVPCYGEWILNIRSVPIKRQDPRASLKAINQGIDLINQGFSLLVFPEGTRSHGKPHRDFKKGSLRLATKPGVPIIPVTIDGTFKIFEERGILTGNQSVTLTVHETIQTAGLSKDEQNNLTEKVQTIIESVLPEEYRHTNRPIEKTADNN